MSHHHVIDQCHMNTHTLTRNFVLWTVFKEQVSTAAVSPGETPKQFRVLVTY